MPNITTTPWYGHGYLHGNAVCNFVDIITAMYTEYKAKVNEKTKKKNPRCVKKRGTSHFTGFQSEIDSVFESSNISNCCAADGCQSAPYPSLPVCGVKSN